MLRRLVVVLTLAASAGVAQAHIASDSYLRLELSDSGTTIGGQWDIALRDLDVAVGLDADQDGAITWGELRAKAREVEDYAFGHLAIARGGVSCRVVPAGMMVDRHAGLAYAVLPFAVECPIGGQLILNYRLLFDIDPTHRGLLSVKRGDAVVSDVLSPDHRELRLDGAPSGIGEQIVRFLSLGFEHILLGYDHLLFIAVLLVVAAMHRGRGAAWAPTERLGRVLVDTIATLTAFTLAHAAVLAVAVVWPVNVPVRVVEPAIAATIMLAGIDNCRPILPHIRWQVAFAFGIVHGLSFASALGPMNLPPLGIGLALLCFNLGVEAGQIAVALLLVPIAFVLRHDAIYRMIVAPSVSVMAVLLAGVWLLDRVFGLDFLPLQSTMAAASLR